MLADIKFTRIKFVFYGYELCTFARVCVDYENVCVCVFALILSQKTAVITDSNLVRPQGRQSTMYRAAVIIPQ